MKTITFTGGFGAQLLSAAAYYYLEKTGQPVRAGFEYFDFPEKIKKQEALGFKYVGKETLFPWQLDEIGLSPSDFNQAGKPGEIVHDGELKQRLARLGLNDSEIRKRFQISSHAEKIKEEMFADQPYICVHIRRGDYLKVASYLVGDEDFIKAIEATSRLVKNVLILTDSPLAQDFISKLNALQLNCRVAIAGSPGIAHSLMRMSDILICSNSQYSFSAAALRPSNSFTLLPSRHDADLNSDANKYLASIRTFQIYSP